MRASAAEIEPILEEAERMGFQLTGPAHRIWAGERDAGALTAGLDTQDTAPVRRVLELLEQ